MTSQRDQEEIRAGRAVLGSSAVGRLPSAEQKRKTIGRRRKIYVPGKEVSIHSRIVGQGFNRILNARRRHRMCILLSFTFNRTETDRASVRDEPIVFGNGMWVYVGTIMLLDLACGGLATRSIRATDHDNILQCAHLSPPQRANRPISRPSLEAFQPPSPRRVCRIPSAPHGHGKQLAVYGTRKGIKARRPTTSYRLTGISDLSDSLP